MKSSRTATIASRIFEPEGGAAAYRLGALRRALEAAGYGTTVLTTTSPGARTSTARIKRWPALRDRSGSVRGYLQYASFDIPLFFRLLFGPRADIVIVEPPPTTGASARLACWIRRTPYAYFSADVSTSAAQSIGAPRVVVSLLRRLERWVLRGATIVLAVSDAVKDEVIGIGANPGTITVVGTGVDTEQFSISGPLADATYPYFVYAGTMSEMQGAKVFIEAFAQIAAAHSTARMKMFGQGVEASELQTRAKELIPDRIEFLGQVNATELAPWVRGARAGLASSRPRDGYNFAISTKAFVSLSCGVPVIYAGDGPLKQIITDNSLGWAVPWDVTAVAEAMESALRTTTPHTRRQEMSQWVQGHHSLNTVARQAVRAITTAISA